MPYGIKVLSTLVLVTTCRLIGHHLSQYWCTILSPVTTFCKISSKFQFKKKNTWKCQRQNGGHVEKYWLYILEVLMEGGDMIWICSKNVHGHYVWTLWNITAIQNTSTKIETPRSDNRLALFGGSPYIVYISSNFKSDIAIAPRLVHPKVNSLWPEAFCTNMD